VASSRSSAPDRSAQPGAADAGALALPKSAHPGAKEALAEIWNAGDKDQAQAADNVFAADYGTKWPKAAAKITDDLDVLLAFHDYPAEHWIHLRTTNPIECTIATVRLRQRVTKGPGSRAAGVAMAFKLIESAQTRWRAVIDPPESSPLDIYRYRNMIAPWHEQRRRRTSSTRSPSSSAGRSWCCCGRVRGR
jgi:mutator family transposase